MKYLKIAIFTLACGLISTVNGQHHSDTNDTQEMETSAKESTTSLRMMASSGYHPGNYKQTDKAKKVKRWYKTRGLVNRTTQRSSYKNAPITMPANTVTDKQPVQSKSLPLRSRNYKQPH